MKYTFDALNVYLGTIKVLYNRRRLTKHCCAVEKNKIGAVFVKCVVFNTSCVANFPSVTLM